jgi:hypothetical protein
MNTSTKTILWAIVGLVTIIAIVYFLQARNRAPLEGNGTVCTADALQCPDGSWVGRSGPNCQFVCPIGTTTQSTREALLETKIDQGASALDVRVIPIAIVEESRCPHGVQCIQAGTVRVRAQLVSGLGTATEVFTLNTPITTEAETVTLVAVSPEPEAGKTIAPKDYRFIFKVSKR